MHIRKTSLSLHDERVDLVVRILRQDLQPDQLTQLRAELLSNLSCLDGLMKAALRRQLASAVLHNLNAMGVFGIVPPGRTRPDNILGQLQDAHERLEQRRGKFADTLKDIIQCLNASGVQPLVLKGSISLIDGHPSWRFQRDIDFAINPSEADQTVSALRQAGFSECHNSSAQPHHLRPMERHGVPGTIEPHVKLADARAGSALPDPVLLKTAATGTWQTLKYRRLSNAGFLLHGLAHHHFQNRGYLFGTFSLKGLAEFGAALQAMDEADVRDLIEITSANATLKAGLDLWLALSERVLGCSKVGNYEVDATAYLQAADFAKRYLAGETLFPFRAATDHIELMRNCGSGRLTLADYIATLSEAGHSAVWFRYNAQRHNASGILQVA